jgi:hypothetical protein
MDAKNRTGARAGTPLYFPCLLTFPLTDVYDQLALSRDHSVKR